MGFPIVAVLISTGVSIALGQLRPKVQKPKPQDLEGWKAEEGRVLEYVGGIAPVEGNVAWWGDSRHSDDIPTAYNANLVVRLCQGPIDQILDFQAGGKSIRFQVPGRRQSSNLETYVIDPGLPYPAPGGDWTGDFVDFDINARLMFGGEEREGGLEKRVRVYRGGLSQSTIDQLTSHSWELAGLEATGGSAYPGVCYAAFGRHTIENAEFYFGTIAQPKAMLWILTRYPRALLDLGLDPDYTSHIIGFDSNPAELIYELSVDARHGLGIAPTAIDLPSLARGGALWQREQLGQTVHLTRLEKGKDILDELLKAVDCVYTPHPVTGLLTLTPLRNDYALGSLLTVTDNPGGANAWDLEEVTPLAQDSYNQVQVNYRRFAGGNVGPVTDEPLSPAFSFELHGWRWYYTKGKHISNVVVRIGSTTLTPVLDYHVQSPIGLIVVFKTATTEALVGQPVEVDYVSNPENMRFEEAHITEDLLGDQLLTGETRPLQLELPYTTNDVVASRIAARTKLRVGRQFKQYRWKMNRQGYVLYPGAVCKITSARLGLVDFAVRVGDVDQGTLQNPVIEVIAVEDAWAQDAAPTLPPVGGGPDGVRSQAPAMAIGCGIGGAGVSRVALFPSDTLYDVEVWEANDAVGTGATLVATIAGATVPMVYDGTVGKYYQARQVQPDDLADPGPFAPWITCAAVAEPPVDPACVEPTYYVASTWEASSGSIELTITDPQIRVRRVEFRHKIGGGAWSLWAEDTEAPYTDSVTLDPGIDSRIEWRILYQNCAGDEVYLEGGYDFSADPPEEEDDEPEGIQAVRGGDIALLLEPARFTAVSADVFPVSEDWGHSRRVDLSLARFGRVAASVRRTSLPVGAKVGVQGWNDADEEWQFLNEDGDGPVMAVDPDSIGEDAGAILAGDDVAFAEWAWADIAVRGVILGGDGGAGTIILEVLALQPIYQSGNVPEEPPEPDPDGVDEDPGSCEVAALLDMDTGWTEVGSGAEAVWSDESDTGDTLTLSGDGEGEVYKQITLTGLTPSKLHTFYLTVNPNDAAVGAFLQVVGGETAVAEGTGAQTLRARGDSNASGEITLRRGVQDQGAAPGSLFFSDPMNYATVAEYEAAGWTVNGGGTVSIETIDTDGQAAVLKAAASEGTEAYISRPLATVPGRTYTATIRAKNYADNTFDTGSRLQWEGGFNDSVNTDNWQGMTVDRVAVDGSETIQIGRFGGFFGLPGTFFGLFHGIEISDGVSGGGAVVEFSDLGYCEGSGIGENTGGGPDGDEEVPPVENPYTGLGLFGMAAIPSRGAGVWNSTIKHISVINCENIYNTASAANMRLLAKLSGADGDWAKPFNLSRILANIDALADAQGDLVQTALEEGVFPAGYVFDEPQRVERYGRVVTVAEVNQVIARYRANWPLMPLVLRVDPTHGAGYNADIFWAQYHKRRGEVNAYLASRLAAAVSLGKQVALSMNVIDFGGTGSGSGSHDRWASADDCRHYGGIIIEAQSHPSAAAMICPYRFEEAWYAQAGMAAAWIYLRDLFTAVHG